LHDSEIDDEEEHTELVAEVVGGSEAADHVVVVIHYSEGCEH